MKYNIPDRVMNDIEKFAKKNNIEKVMLFGSRARGTHSERSDIDLAASGGNISDFYLDLTYNAWTLLTFDVVDLDKGINEELEKEIKRDGVIIYEGDRYFARSLKVLQSADFTIADKDEIYKTGIIGQFILTFEHARKALQAVLREHGAGGDSMSPREILQIGYKFGFIEDQSVWLSMLRSRNSSVHLYDEEKIDEMLLLIRDSYIPAFSALEDTLRKKLDETGEDWN